VETVGDILCPPPRYTDSETSGVGIMDFKITPAHPDGLRVEVEFWVETWEDIPKLMHELQEADAEV